MTKAELEQTIKDIEGGIASPSVPEKFKANMRSQLTMLKGKLAEMSKPSAPVKPKTTPKSTSTKLPLVDLYEDFYVKGYENKAMNFAYVPDFKGKESVYAYSMGLEDGKTRKRKSLSEFEDAFKNSDLKTEKSKPSLMNDLRGKKKAYPDRETAMSLMDTYADGMEEFDIEDTEELLSDQVKQNHLIKYLNKKILSAYKDKGLSEDIRDILEDENYHGLNEYLGLSGLYGSETQKYYLTFKKKHGGADWKKKQLNPKFFGLEADDEETKKKGVPLPKEKQSSDDDYDCDELIEKEKNRRAKAKERASKPKKSEATKNKEKLEKVFDNVKERAIEEDITKAELEKLISSTEDLLKLLKDKLAKLK